METNEIILGETALDRRSLLKRAGIAGATMVAGGVLAGCGGSGVSSNRGVTDADVLNFALNLEYLEAEFYLRAVNGTGLSAGDIGANPGAVTGGSQVTFTTPAIQQYAQEIAADELAHVQFLRSALGSAAVDRPAIDFTAAFNAAGVAAGLGAGFNPFADQTSFLLGSFVFEDVGVTAYHGGATLIRDKNLLSAAAGILGTEAYHASLVRTVIYNIGGSAVTSAQAISDLRDSVDGGDDDDQGVTSGGVANIVPTDSNGLTYARTTTQVLNIVYLNANTTPGGFFPNGLNGKIR